LRVDVLAIVGRAAFPAGAASFLFAGATSEERDEGARGEEGKKTHRYDLTHEPGARFRKT
jgi:hypothetical protein